MLFTFLKMRASYFFPHSSPQPFKNDQKQPSSDLWQLCQQQDEVLVFLCFNTTWQWSTTRPLIYSSAVGWGRESEKKTHGL